MLTASGREAVMAAETIVPNEKPSSSQGETVLKRWNVDPELVVAVLKLLATLWRRWPLAIVSMCSSRVVTSSPTWVIAHWTGPSVTGFPGRCVIVGVGG